MKQLIEALQIFQRYAESQWPTHCEHDVLMVVGVTQDEVSEADRVRLDYLGFLWSNEYDCWISYRFGSA